MNIRFVPVKWGKRLYLVDENELPGFCGAIAKKDFPEGLHGDDYVKFKGEELPKVEGKPIVPLRYEEFLEKGPIEATVTRVEASGDVVLDKGSENRLKPGMLLASQSWDRIELKIKSTTPKESVAVAFYYWNSDRPVRVGDSVTTGEMYHRPGGTGFERFAKPPSVKKPSSR